MYSLVFFTIYGCITNSQRDQLSVGLIAQLVEHSVHRYRRGHGCNPGQARIFFRLYFRFCVRSTHICNGLRSCVIKVTIPANWAMISNMNLPCLFVVLCFLVCYFVYRVYSRHSWLRYLLARHRHHWPRHCLSSHLTEASCSGKRVKNVHCHLKGKHQFYLLYLSTQKRFPIRGKRVTCRG